MSQLPPTDPFDQGPEAEARERRRREREARRREREQRVRSERIQRSLADRVSTVTERVGEAAANVARGGSIAAGEGGKEPPPMGRRAAAPPPRSRPVGPPPADPPPPPSPEAQASRLGAAPPTGSPAVEPEPTAVPARSSTAAEETVEFDPFAGETGGPPRRGLGLATLGGGDADGTIWRRRIIAAGALLAGLVLILIVARGIFGGDGSAEQQPVAAGEPVATTSVTIPEGLSLEDMAEVAKDANLRGNYAKAARKPPKGFNPDRYGAGDAPSLEGFLFPATYEVERRAPVEDLIAKQLEAFEQNISEVNLKAAERKNLTAYDVVNIASMIEREVSIDKERRLASAVIYNRLADGEPLGIDATLRYGLDKPSGQLLESELQTDSEYNTRTRAGLPPTPIGNPGLASLKAAANPADSDVRYYVIKPGTCNEHLFTADAAEFEAAVAEYQSALEAGGGSPTDC
jgi:hypothetical protein